MKVSIPLIALSRASPLHDFHRPQNTDEKHLDHHITNMPEVRKGLVGIKVDYDHFENGQEEESCRIELSTDNANASMLLLVIKREGWKYEADLEFNNGEKRRFEGIGQHDSKHALIRKVRGLIKIMLGN